MIYLLISCLCFPKPLLKSIQFIAEFHYFRRLDLSGIKYSFFCSCRLLTSLVCYKSFILAVLALVPDVYVTSGKIVAMIFFQHTDGSCLLTDLISGWLAFEGKCYTK